MTSFSRAELIIAAAAQAWRDDGEIVAAGIGPLPRLAASLAKLTLNPALLLTDGESYFVEDPVPLGPRDVGEIRAASWAPYRRMFDIVWSGRRHAMVGPSQVDRWGQMNISCLGPHEAPKVQLVGVRGFPCNSVCHPNSMFVPAHSTRVFVADEVDVVCSAGYNKRQWPAGADASRVDLRLIVTDLCIMDFKGPDNAIRVVSLHPGVTFDEVQAATGFTLHAAPDLSETRAPTEEELAIIRRLDPHNIRATVIKGDPPGRPH